MDWEDVKGGAAMLLIAAAVVALCLVPALILYSCLWAWNQFPHEPSSTWEINWDYYILGAAIFALLWHLIDALKVRRSG